MHDRSRSRLGPRAAVTSLFVVAGAVYGSWAARIPAIKSDLSLTDGELAIALWAFAAGAVAAMPVVAWFIRRCGARTVSRVVAPGFAAALAAPGVATSRGQLVIALVVVGVFGGALDVAMNACGVALQRGRPRPLMQSLHGGYGMGLACGGVLAVGAAASGLAARWHLLLAAATLLAIAVVVTRHLPSVASHTTVPGTEVSGTHPVRVIHVRWLAPVLAFAACAAFVEVSLTEWGGVYTQQVLRGSPTAATAAFAVFAVAMTAGRLAGDRPLQRLGPNGIRYGAAATAVALAAALASGRPLPFLVALAVCGVGIAWAFPAAIVAADAVAGERGIALVSAAAYVAGLVGPPTLGFVAETTSLTVAFCLISLAAAACAVLALSLGRPHPSPERPRARFP